jgi:hypothetical protein
VRVQAEEAVVLCFAAAKYLHGCCHALVLVPAAHVYGLAVKPPACVAAVLAGACGAA